MVMTFVAHAQPATEHVYCKSDFDDLTMAALAPPITCVIMGGGGWVKANLGVMPLQPPRFLHL